MDILGPHLKTLIRGVFTGNDELLLNVKEIRTDV